MVTVFGLGFVGLTTALGFASMGYKVYGVDVDDERKKQIRNGQLPFLEPLMDDVLTNELGKNFFVVDEVADAVRESEYIYYCVGTPYGEDGSADLTYLFSAIDQTIECIDDDRKRVIVTKSTIPPSTTKEKIVPYVSAKGEKAKHISVANNPEFLREGHCWDDFINADRIVVGCDDAIAESMLRELYAPMQIPFFAVSLNTGEYIKYLSNTLLATLISYSNEMAQIADAIGDIQVADAFRILHMDKRWNNCNMSSYVYPGCGYGGYCLPKDTNALLAQTKEKGYEPQILKNVIEVNDKRAYKIADHIIKECVNKGFEESSKIGILGLSFKPESDDVRDTPAARIVRELIRLGCNNIIGYDPVANREFESKYSDLSIELIDSYDEIIEKADILVITTAWDEFKEIKTRTSKHVIDCRYILK